MNSEAITQSLDEYFMVCQLVSSSKVITWNKASILKAFKWADFVDKLEKRGILNDPAVSLFIEQHKYLHAREALTKPHQYLFSAIITSPFLAFSHDREELLHVASEEYKKHAADGEYEEFMKLVLEPMVSTATTLQNFRQQGTHAAIQLETVAQDVMAVSLLQALLRGADTSQNMFVLREAIASDTVLSLFFHALCLAPATIFCSEVVRDDDEVEDIIYLLSSEEMVSLLLSLWEEDSERCIRCAGIDKCAKLSSKYPQLKKYNLPLDDLNS